MLIKKKEEICGLTLQNLDMACDSSKEMEIKKNFTTILSLLNHIASYSESKNYNFEKVTNSMNMLFLMMSQEQFSTIWVGSPIAIELMRNYANSVRFDFKGKEGLKIVFPKNINLGNITNR